MFLSSRYPILLFTHSKTLVNPTDTVDLSIVKSPLVAHGCYHNGVHLVRLMRLESADI